MSTNNYFEGFNKQGFMEFINEEFPEPMLYSFTRDLIEHIIEYGYGNKNVSKDQLCYFISDLLPGVEFWEVAKFCEESKLTKDTLKLAYSYNTKEED